jgi:hypothetical protein
MLKLSWGRAAMWRAGRQHLVQRAKPGSMLAVAGRLCGLHAQVLSSAELTAWARVEGLKRQDVQRALWQDRTLVKTWAMRGTLHLLPTSELPLWYGALTTNRRFLREAQWKKNFGLSLDDLDRLTDAIGAVLENRMLTREELAREVGEIAGRRIIAESSWGTALRPAAFTGRLCFAPGTGNRVRFTHPDTWVKLAAAVDPQIATLEATRRYLAAFGPATVHDLARWWSGTGVSTARQWIAALADEAASVDVEGEPAWMLARDVRGMRDVPTERSVRLLPAFDQYVIGASAHCHRMLPGDLRARVYRPQGWISPVLLVNGMMHGVWRHEVQGSRVAVTVEPFVKLPVWVRRAAGEEAERLAKFLDCALDLYFS